MKIKTIAIFAFGYITVPPWDKDSLEEGLMGSEESVVYMADELAKLGYEVVVYNNPPKNSRYSKTGMNPRYKSYKEIGSEVYDIGIIWRFADYLKIVTHKAKQFYYWPHDMYKQFADNSLPLLLLCQDVLWISKWQRENWMEGNSSFEKYRNIFGNGIDPSQFSELKERENPYSCIYGSNYGKGLEVLIEIWSEVKKEFPEATLDIYYGWSHWGLLSNEQEKHLRETIEKQKENGVTDHGKVGHRELVKAFEKASFWTYPCTALETFCITGIRAEAAGATPVIIENSALKETIPFGFRCYKKEDYLKTLLHALEQRDKISLKERSSYREFVFKNFSWAKIAKDWSALFEKNV